MRIYADFGNEDEDELFRLAAPPISCNQNVTTADLDNFLLVTCTPRKGEAGTSAMCKHQAKRSKTYCIIQHDRSHTWDTLAKSNWKRNFRPGGWIYHCTSLCLWWVGSASLGATWCHADFRSGTRGFWKQVWCPWRWSLDPQTSYCFGFRKSQEVKKHCKHQMFALHWQIAVHQLRCHQDHHGERWKDQAAKRPRCCLLAI